MLMYRPLELQVRQIVTRKDKLGVDRHWTYRIINSNTGGVVQLGYHYFSKEQAVTEGAKDLKSIQEFDSLETEWETIQVIP